MRRSWVILAQRGNEVRVPLAWTRRGAHRKAARLETASWVTQVIRRGGLRHG